MANVMVLEDDPCTQRALHDVAERLGHTVRSFSEPELAMEAIEHQRPDVLVTDWDLGARLSGIDVALHALAAGPSARIILITGNDIGELKQKTRHMSNVRYIPKPFDLLTVRRAFADACAGSD